jgi:effector-binding domain-containing protein
MMFADRRGLVFSGLPAAIGLLAFICLTSVGLAGSPVVAAPSPAGSATPVLPPATPAPSATEAAPDTNSAHIVNVEAKPVAIINGTAKWGDGLSAIVDSETKLRAALLKAGLKSIGHPLTVFTQTDDNGFTYEAMLPLAERPQGKIDLGEGIKLGSSLAGRAMKFQYHGPYDDIDSTYDLITAYLDEKDLEAKDYFVEEYVTDPESADDPKLAVDIYIFIK